MYNFFLLLVLHIFYAFFPGILNIFLLVPMPLPFTFFFFFFFHVQFL